MHAPDVLDDYTVRTRNPSAGSENRMHSDDVARAFGYRGALVPGVTVFAHLTRPLVARHGLDWLERSVSEVTFAQPAYDGDLLTVRATRGDDAGDPMAWALQCLGPDGTVLARLATGRPQRFPEPDPQGDLPPAAAASERPVVTWEAMVPGEPFPALAWRPTRAEHDAWCEDTRDDLGLYAQGDTPPVHPGLCLRQANLALRNRFVLPAWIHTGSRIVVHAAPRVGELHEVRTVPLERWEHKGHAFVRLHVAIRSAGRTCWDIRHTAIFLPRQARAAGEGALRA